MNWQVIIERMQQVEKQLEGSDMDPFLQLAVKARTKGVPAKISMTVGRAVQYGEIKCSATVSIDCPQQEGFIDLAAEVAYTKALELVNDGMESMGIPRIGE